MEQRSEHASIGAGWIFGKDTWHLIVLFLASQLKHECEWKDGGRLS
jgi:hypothetical protein